MDAPPLARRGRVPVILVVSLALTGIGQTLLYAILPLTSRTLALSGYQSSLVFALSALLWSLSSPFWGRMADRGFGLRTIVLGMGGQGLSNLAVGAVIALAIRGRVPHAAVFPSLLLLRGVNGILGSAVLPAAQSLALRRAPARPRISIIGTVSSSWAIGAMAGFGFAAALAVFGIPVPLFVAAALSMACAAIMALAGDPGPRAVTIRTSHRRASRVLRRRLRRFMAMQLAVGTANNLVSQATGFFVQDEFAIGLHAANAVVGLGLSIEAGMSLMTQILAIRLRPGPITLMFCGGASLTVAAVTIYTVRQPYVVVAALGLMGVGLGASTLGISTTASLRARAAQQGGVAGALASAGSLGAIVSAMAVMPFYAHHHGAPYLVVAAMGSLVVAGAVQTARSGFRPPASERPV